MQKKDKKVNFLSLKIPYWYLICRSLTSQFSGLQKKKSKNKCSQNLSPHNYILIYMWEIQIREKKLTWNSCHIQDKYQQYNLLTCCTGKLCFVSSISEVAFTYFFSSLKTFRLFSMKSRRLKSRNLMPFSHICVLKSRK